jgi:hypothetical protein
VQTEQQLDRAVMPRRAEIIPDKIPKIGGISGPFSQQLIEWTRPLSFYATNYGSDEKPNRHNAAGGRVAALAAQSDHKGREPSLPP